jgi:hypothetical protein
LVLVRGRMNATYVAQGMATQGTGQKSTLCGLVADAEACRGTKQRMRPGGNRSMSAKKVGICRVYSCKTAALLLGPCARRFLTLFPSASWSSLFKVQIESTWRSGCRPGGVVRGLITNKSMLWYRHELSQSLSVDMTLLQSCLDSIAFLIIAVRLLGKMIFPRQP